MYSFATKVATNNRAIEITLNYFILQREILLSAQVKSDKLNWKQFALLAELLSYSLFDH